VIESVPASVIVPTLGRLDRLRACLDSLAACRPAPNEVLLVVQGRAEEVEKLAAVYSRLPLRVVSCRGRGVSGGRNLGLRSAANELVLVTDDDCTVAVDWVAKAYELTSAAPQAIITGRVLPAGNPDGVPSTKTDELACDFTGETHGGALFPNNMAGPRTALLAAGGFDERFGPDEAAEDNEFCYRWLKGGGALRYEPALVVWHHDWRSSTELAQLYVSYARGQGFFYAKHLRSGDLRMLRYLVRDLVWAVRGLASRLVRPRHGWVDPRLGIIRGLPGGLVAGWRAYGRGSPAADEQSSDAGSAA
jgi:GT2 family glycosyltransferase